MSRRNRYERKFSEWYPFAQSNNIQISWNVWRLCVFGCRFHSKWHRRLAKAGRTLSIWKLFIRSAILLRLFWNSVINFPPLKEIFLKISLTWNRWWGYIFITTIFQVRFIFSVFLLILCVQYYVFGRYGRRTALAKRGPAGGMPPLYMKK